MRKWKRKIKADRIEREDTNSSENKKPYKQSERRERKQPQTE